MSDNTFHGIICAIIYITVFGMLALATNLSFSIFSFLALTAILFWMS
jgi:hypothetical protein